MPRAPQRCSPGCKEKVVRGGKCEIHQPPRIPWVKTEETPDRSSPGAYRNSADWRRQRRRILYRDNTYNGGCQGRYVEDCTGTATTVDHIAPVWYIGHDEVDDNDLQGLCETCHNFKSSRDGYFAKMHKRAKEASP